MLERVISGGQTGADQAAWRAARACGFDTGGFMPKGFRTEDGTHPEFASQFQAQEMPTDSYANRTTANVQEADGTLWFGSPDSPGGTRTLSACRVYRRPNKVIPLDAETVYPSQVVQWILDTHIRILNIAGNRESVQKGIGERTEAFLRRVFAQLREKSLPS